MKQKFNFIAGLGVAALLASGFAGAQETVTEGPFSVTFPEGRLDIDDTQTLPAACTGTDLSLVSVKADYTVRTRVDLETTNNTSGETRTYDVTVSESPLSLTVGGVNVIASESPGIVNVTGSLDAGETAMDAEDPLTDIDGETTFSSTGAFGSGSVAVRFVAVGDSIVRNASNVNSVVNHFGQASVSVVYTCEREIPVCPLDPSIPADDPLCVPCEFNPNILASNPACVPPPAVPGMTSFGLLASVLGLPLIAGFFAARRRMKK